MKDKAEIAAVFYTVLGALKAAKESPHSTMGGIPNGHLYAQLMEVYNIDMWTKIVQALRSSGHVTESNHLLVITDKGTKLWEDLHKIYQESKLKVERSGE